MGAGLSSSAALEVLTAYALTYVAGKTTDKAGLAKLCQRVENEYVGVRCGIMDQFSVALSRKGQLLILDCSSENYSYANYALRGYGLVVMNTNVPRELRVSKYNERRRECEMALRELQSHQPELRHLAYAKRQSWKELANESQKRTRYVIEEQERVRECVRALEEGDAKHVGQLMNESHWGLQNLYEVTGKHLDALCTAAQNHPACAGARMTGAGFGGCAIALVAVGSENDFIHSVGESYHAQTGMHADFYAVLPCEGVRRL
jgi:galactokinase